MELISTHSPGGLFMWYRRCVSVYEHRAAENQRFLSSKPRSHRLSDSLQKKATRNFPLFLENKLCHQQMC